MHLPLSCILALDLKGSERLPALETEPLGSRCDQSAKRAHPLRSHLLDLGFDGCPDLPQHISDRSHPSTELTAERAWDLFHQCTFFILPTPNHDRTEWGILSQIAHEVRKIRKRLGEIGESMW